MATLERELAEMRAVAIANGVGVVTGVGGGPGVTDAPRAGSASAAGRREEDDGVGGMIGKLATAARDGARCSGDTTKPG
jgi:hypothetical protein